MLDLALKLYKKAIFVKDHYNFDCKREVKLSLTHVKKHCSS